MIIIWGTRARKKDVSSGQFYCPRCGRERFYTHKRVVRYFTLFFIPLIPLNTVGEYVECQGCSQAFKPEVLDYAPPSRADQFLGALVADLESGTPLQMLHRKLINAGIDEEPAKVAVAAAIADSASGEELKLCPRCDLLYVQSVSRCSICGAPLMGMPRSRAKPSEQSRDEEQEETGVDASYSIGAPAGLQDDTDDQEEGAADDRSGDGSSSSIAVLAGVGVLVIGAVAVLLIVFGGEDGTVDAALTAQSTERPLLVSASATPLRPTKTPSPMGTPRPGPTTAPMPGDIVLHESFSGPESQDRWVLSSGDGFTADIENGELILSVTNADDVAWAHSTRAYSAMDLRVEAKKLEGGSEATYGIMFGVGSSDDNYVACLVPGYDAAICLAVANGREEGGDLVEVEASPEGQSNRMRLVTLGDQWAFYVNGKCVGSGQSEAVQRGQIGLIAMTDSESLWPKIAYDDLVIRAPDTVSRALLGCDPR